jgi:hypothetical protein
MSPLFIELKIKFNNFIETKNTFNYLFYLKKILDDKNQVLHLEESLNSATGAFKY